MRTIFILLLLSFSTSAFSQLYCPPGFKPYLPEDGSRRHLYYKKGDIHIVVYHEGAIDAGITKKQSFGYMIKENKGNKYAVLTKDSLFVTSGFDKEYNFYFYRVSDGYLSVVVTSPKNDIEFSELSKFILRQKRYDRGYYDLDLL